MKEVYETLEKIGIPYEKHEHPPVYTTEEADEYMRNIDAADTKNLFLRDQKGKNYYLVILPAEERADLKKLAGKLNEKKLSFGSSEKLKLYLGLEPGSVSPFGLINDEKAKVKVLVNEKLLKENKIGFHPNKNTATVVISTKDFRRFLEQSGNTASYFS